MARHDELHLVSKMEKPANPILLSKKVADLINESLWYQENIPKIDPDEEDFDKKFNFIKSSPKPLPLAISFGRSLSQMGDYEKAIEVFDYAASVNPDNLAVKTEVAKIHIIRGNLDDARTLLEEAQKISPKNLDRICKIGEINMQELQIDEATEKFNEALELDPGDEDAINGNILCDNLSEFFRGTDVTALPKTFAGLLNAVGISLVRKGRLEEGIEHYNAAMEYVYMDYEKGKISFNVGLGYERNDQNDKAQVWYERSKELWPDGEKANRRLEALKSGGSLGAPEESQEATLEDETIYPSRNLKKVD